MTASSQVCHWLRDHGAFPVGTCPGPGRTLLSFFALGDSAVIVQEFPASHGKPPGLEVYRSIPATSVEAIIRQLEVLAPAREDRS